MNRRLMLKLLGGTALLGATPRAAPAAARSPVPQPDWSALQSRLGARLIKVTSPLQAVAEQRGAGADLLFRKLKNPYYLGSEPALTQTLGWIDAWTSRASDYAVAAESAADVAAAINFSRANAVRPVVKGGGHSYFGNSNAAGSLLIWTRPMRSITLEDQFRPVGAPSALAPEKAVSVGAGAIWGEVYRAVAVEGDRYVQGGGCLTVGVAGFVMGGGFGSFSRRFGTGAANLLEAEVVTADGVIRIANAYREPELFHALRGGGGGSFGVVTRLTLKTHPLPETIGAVLFSVRASSETAWRALVARTIDFYADTLLGPVWGEQLRLASGRKMDVSMLCHGLDAAAIRRVWAPLLTWIEARPMDYAFLAELAVVALPGRSFWDPSHLKSLPGIVLADDRPGASADNIFWASNLSEAGQVLNAYQSAWLPVDLLQPDRRASLVDALVAAAAVWPTALHMNKGLAGGSPEALQATRETATSPAVLDAFALLICAADAPPAWPGIPGHEPDVANGRNEAARVTRAMAPIRRLVPNAGSYVSESDYFAPDWQQAYWGDRYPRLLATKRRYDPANMFTGHHCVGQAAD